MDIVLILFLIFLNGLFAMTEMALVSVSGIRLEQDAQQGQKTAELALALSKQPTQFLSTVQIGITLISILSGVVGEEAIAARIEPFFASFEPLAPYAQSISVGVMVLCITSFSLIFGELVPKRIALVSPEAIAKIMAYPMWGIMRLSSPLVRLLSISTDTILTVLRVNKIKKRMVTEEEIHVLIEQGTAAGVIDESEQEMVRNVLRLDDQRVSNLMTLRKEILYLDLEDSFQENKQKIAHGAHSRMPLCKGGLDHVIGVVHSKEILAQTLAGHPIDLTSVCRPILFVPDAATASQLLEQFKKAKTHLAMVIDEHGQSCGLVTMNDVLESIVGDVPAEGDDYEPDFVERSDGSWLVSGQIDIDDLKNRFNLDLSQDESNNYHTLGGFILSRLGHIPKVADHLEYEHYRFEVMDMDSNRVDKVLISKLDLEKQEEKERVNKSINTSVI